MIKISDSLITLLISSGDLKPIYGFVIISFPPLLCQLLGSCLNVMSVLVAQWARLQCLLA